MRFFSRWTRKPYSIFNSLGSVIKICVLIASCSILATPGKTQVLTDSLRIAKKIQLEGVVVTAQRTPAVASQVARVVRVISKEEIEDLPVQSLDGILEYALNVDVRQRGGNGVQADVSVRGGSFDQTLILLNGVNVSDPQTGHHNLDIPIDIGSIERVEILEGPGARIFGANAFNGVINIITGTGKSGNGTVNLMTGDYGLYKADLSGTVSTGKITHYLSLSHSSCEGYTDNTDFKVDNFFYNAKLDTKAGQADLQVGYATRDFGANSFYTPKYPNQFEATRTLFGSLRFQGSGKLHLTPSLYWRRHNDKFELFRDNPPDWYTSHNYHVTDVYGAGLSSWFVSGIGKTSLGLDFRSENILSNVLGEPLSTPIKVPGEDGVFYTNGHTRNNISLFAEHSIYLSRFSFSAGLMVSQNSDNKDKISLYPGVDLGFEITKGIRWYASGSRTLRLPTFTDLYYSSPTNLGNPNLKPEEAIVAETGFKLNRAAFEGHVAIFQRWGRNMIDWVKYPDETVWKAMNLTEVDISGIEFSTKWKPRNTFGSNFFITAVQFDYAYLYANKKSGDFDSKYVLDNLRHKIDVGIDHKIIWGLGASWRLSYQARVGTYQKWENAELGVDVPYKPFWLGDARLYWKFVGFTLYAETTNIFNTEYFDNANVPQPGRWFKAGLKVDFNWKKK
jgi:iron complex outermembrane receptor protein